MLYTQTQGLCGRGIPVKQRVPGSDWCESGVSLHADSSFLSRVGLLLITVPIPPPPHNLRQVTTEGLRPSHRRSVLRQQTSRSLFSAGAIISLLSWCVSGGNLS
ncbi:hypothetical protein LSTR_LSTR004346 [Laodelphax striatellus]|uniref:Uncharacterized protein n=1 Tax=Laodelphax striatellus TaxID=195883 RepID=A0A482X913_LAOST|nr:hypothetical protein LSTR_LSTR004346 [Laodelphax striatellus]